MSSASSKRKDGLAAEKAPSGKIRAGTSRKEEPVKKGSSEDARPEATQRDKRTLDFLIAIVGFGLCRAWIVCCLAAPILHASSSVFNWLFLVSGALAALFIAFVVRRLKESIVLTRRSLILATGVALVLSAIVIPFASAFGTQTLLFAGFIIGGIGAGLLQVLWGERFASHEISFATIASPSAAVVTALLVSASSSSTGLIGYVIFPLLSFTLLLVMAERTGIKVGKVFERRTKDIIEADAQLLDRKAQSYNGETAAAGDGSDGADDRGKAKHLGMEIGKLMFSIMIFSFLCRLFDSVLANRQDPLDFFGGSALFSLIIVGAALLLIIAALKGKFNPTLTYRLSLPIMVAGFVAIALLFDTHAAFSILLINIGYEFFDILSWILFTEVSRREGENPLRIFGLGVAFMFIGMSLGLLGGEVLDALIASGGLQITVVASLSTLCLVIVAFMVIPEGTVESLAHTVRPERKKADDSIDEAPSGEGRLEANCASVAEAYRLTPREGEVLVLLAHGRTLAIIARDLQIAKGTARTHIENIYRKLDVHKQQELIDLVENYEPR